MTPFRCVSGAAAPMTTPNIDTDVIMPKMFLKGVDRSGLGEGAFHLLRFIEDKPNPGFVLNRDGYRDTCFLVVGPNFGCGSSREHAVWGLQQLGIRALIGTSFAGIFNDNCANNGLLTISLDAATVGTLAEIVADPGSNRLTVDLEQQIIRVDGGGNIPFAIEPARKEAFLTGRDAISSTLAFADDIRTFEVRHRADNPWF
ncbi:3-isopropylmalate dehydratase small subunit [Bradyrhizobium guangdongense]|uniref:3-isopropylmalate dehydratase small subunit n=1 Tax=Bradyrhizobium guangdongense TaxID=1325090 RepID=A0A410VBP8_9BRAD|nr:3-isopropylmalate dehydratase small subunit [Bradyrhizobium guangdongense]QAU41050.1 3-isopropylmalate dehydratase small subunit [Bradyrhizobium guangdongense]QOZ62111.1 3-isopropylmalate dehydratase small subunit [Bradyrhizobium guangdongense]GGI21108.1 3-isopropylmalate dehydratase small subunit [Bradyrhizobium guangdongense]